MLQYIYVCTIQIIHKRLEIDKDRLTQDLIPITSVKNIGAIKYKKFIYIRELTKKVQNKIQDKRGKITNL